MSFFRCCAAVVGVSVWSIACADVSPVKKTPSEIITVTQSNLRGHQSLYREGWFVVSSTEKAFAYAKQHALVSSGQAVSEAIQDTGKHSKEYGKELTESGKEGVQTGTQVLKKGTELSKRELAITSSLVKTEWDYGSENMSLAWERFVKGNMTLTQRTEEDRQALAAIPGDWFQHLNSDFRNLNELTDTATQSMSTNIEGRWDEAFAEAHTDFNQSYQLSGTRDNSLLALGDIMVGYVKVAYSGLFKPATRSVIQGSEAAAKGTVKIVFLPASKLFAVSGRTIISTGLSMYYTTSMGVKLVSPTVEGGLLSGLSMLSYSAVPVTAAAGGAVGVVNQVAVTVAAPVAGAGKAVVTDVAETGVYAAQVSYDLIKGSTVVTMNQAQSGIVLGYNALTALPTQMLLGSANAIVLLAYDGPRLVLASAKGEVQWSDKNGVKGRVPVQSLPVGSVVDLKALSKEPGMQVQIISDDPEVVQKALEKLPNDLRVGGKP